MNSKKILAILAASTLMTGAVGCTSSKPDNTTENNTDTNTETTSKPSSETTETGEKKKVTAWAWDKNFNIAALEAAEAIYEAENPDVDIEIIEYAQADIVQKLNTGLSSGSTEGLPNIVLIEDYRIQTFLQSYPGSFKELSGTINEEDFADYKLDFMKLEDKIYGVPFDTGSAAVFYRKDIIEQAGYSQEDMNALTWEKYIEIGKAVKEKTGLAMLTLDPNDVGQVRMMMQSAGSWYVKEDGVTPNLAGNEVLKEALGLYKEMVDSGISKTISEWSQFVGAANNSEVATVPTGCWFTASIMAGADQTGLWGVAPMPRMGKIETSVNASNIGGSSWYVLNDVEGSDLAADFLGTTFAGNTDFYQQILTENGVIATYKPAQTGEAYSQQVEFFDNQAIYSDISKWTENIPPVNYGLHTYAFEDIIKAEVQNMMAGTDIDTCLENAQKQAESQIR